MKAKQILQNVRVLVTGGAGFIGSNLCDRLLEQDNEVICLDNFSTGKRENLANCLQNKKFKLITGDIREPDICRNAVDGVEYVFHQAALGSVPRSVENPITSHDVNLTGTLNMFIAARDAKVKRLVYASSSSVYGDHPALPKVESVLGRPLSPYAITKLGGEHYARAFRDLYDFDTIGLRYFNVFGKRQDPNGAYAAAIPKFTKALIEHKSPMIYGDGTHSRDFTYIENVVEANQLAALAPTQPMDSSVFNVAFGNATTLNELVGTLIELLSKFDSKIRSIRPEHGPNKKGDIPHSLASLELTQKALGYDPKFDIRQGLEDSIGWYWEHLSSNARS